MKGVCIWIAILFLLMVSVFLMIRLCAAQTLFPFYSPFNPLASFLSPIPNPMFSAYYQFNPFLPSLSPVSLFPTPILTPSLMSLPTLNRTAAATIVVLPPAVPTVTAYAPLGTLNLTPSTLVFLILYLTLAE
ncbi:MAG: hypothetical protein ACMUIM_03290 [bacterium]